MEKLYLLFQKNIAGRAVAGLRGFILLAIFSIISNIGFGQIFSNAITDANPSADNPYTNGQNIYSNPITVSGIGRGPGIGGAAASNRYSANNWSTGGLDPNDYFEFTITPTAGNLINFTSFVYTGQISGGASGQSFRSSLSGFTTDIGTPNVAGTTISLAAAAYQNISSTITFRFYTYGVSASTRTFSINDFTFNGTVILAPVLTASDVTAFGNVCKNTVPGANTFQLSGSNLTAANIVIGPLAGYGFSLTNGSFNPTCTITGAVGTLASTTVYVQFSPIAVQSYPGPIPIAGGGATTAAVVSGFGVNTGPSINNGVVSGVTINSAIVTVTVSDPGCTPVVAGGYGIEYSTTTPFINGTGTSVVSANLSAGVFSVNPTGLLSPGTTYYFHTYATNSSGIRTYGAEQSFTLLSLTATLSVPVAGAGSLSGFGTVCANTATATNSFNLTGSVLNGTNITIGPLSNYTFSTAVGGPFSNTLTLINGGSGYSYAGGNLSATIYVKFAPTSIQLYPGNIAITGGGAPLINVPVSGEGVNDINVLSTGSAIFITTVGATLPGTITTAGCGVLLDYGIEYSTTPGFIPGTGTQVSASNLSGSDFSVTLTTLNPNTPYYYYAYATNAGGTGYGSPENNFITADVPVKLIVTAVSPATPTLNTSFSVTIEARDALNNPVDVNTDTDIQLSQSAGLGLLSVPPAVTMPAGSNSITISGLSYNQAELIVGVTATAVTGMVSLTPSPSFTFEVISYVGPNTFIWSFNNKSAWRTGANWQGGTFPGIDGAAAVNQHVATFTNLAYLFSGGCGIFMNSVTDNVHNVGTIYFTNSYNNVHPGDIIPIGNSGSVDGVLRLHGKGINNLGGTGNNYSNVLIANYIDPPNTTQTIDIRNSVGGSANLTLTLVNAGQIVAGSGRSINISTLLTGNQGLTFDGGGSLTLKPSGAATVNTFSGAITVANGTLIAGNNGAFSTVSPNIITLGSVGFAGVLRLNGNNVAIGGLTTAGALGNANMVDNGNASATITIKNAVNYIFNGALVNGTSGNLSLIKTGIGTITLTGSNTYTGTTIINQGTLQLNKTGGGTIPSSSNITVINGGILKVSTNQSITNFDISAGGTLIVDAGVTLTITGTYTPGTCSIINNGVIKLQGGALQSFPGAAATVTTMKDLTINNIFGVNLNKSLNVLGTLTLTNGIFTVGANTLTINNPIAATNTNLAANNTSSLIIAGTAAGIIIPSSVAQLNNLTVSNTIGTVLQGNLNITGTLFITAAAGTVDAGLNTLNGSGNLTMAGGILAMEKNGVVLPELTGLYNLTGGTVSFNGVGVTASDAQTVRAVNYFKLTSTSTGDRILSPSGTIGVADIFTPNLPNNAYTVINSTVNYNKTTAQFIAGFRYYNMTISGGGGITKTLAGDIDIQGALTLATNTKFALANFNTTLKSNAANTANVAIINTANSISYGTGQFIVERYIPTGIAHNKSWQLLATPVSGTQSVKASWQENNLPLANATSSFGTTISSDKAGAVSRGYDFYTPVAPSIKKYNAATNTWAGIDDGATNTSALPISNKKGYMIFVRGDRSVQTSAAAANITTLRTTGKIYSPGTDAPPTTAVAALKFETVGNPYASAIDFTNLVSTSTGIDAKYYVWDPLLPGTNGLGYGGYQLLSSSNLWKPTPGGTLNYPTGIAYTKVQSGQAIFVYSTAGGTVTFAESNKLSGSSLLYRAGSPSDRQFLRVYLHGALSGTMADGNVVAFDQSFSNAFDADDALKISNATESFGITSRGKTLALEARSPVMNRDTVFYNAGYLKEQGYQLRFAPENMAAGGLTAYLVDRFLATNTPVSLSDSTKVNFIVTSDPASKASDRFYIVFKETRPVPVTIVGISAVRNREGNIDVYWQVQNEMNIARYEVERSGDGRNPVGIKATPSTGSSVYHIVDENTLSGDNFYRIKAIGLSGQIQYSAVVKVGAVRSMPSISVYPNPVTDNMLNVLFNNQPAGTYKLQLSNKLGQVVLNNTVVIANNTTIQSFALGKSVTAGIYQLVIFTPGGKIAEQVVVE